MPLSSLNAISPVDGRYHRHTHILGPLLSEFGLIKHRVEVEVKYFIDLVCLPLPQLDGFPKEKFEGMRGLYLHFSEADAQRIKDLEATTNHDVKAVEYWIKEEMVKLGVSQWSEFVHFGLTSQDVNNTAIPLSLKRATEEVYLPIIDEVIAKLSGLANDWKSVPMLARTHGQSASPVTLGKEVSVFENRLRVQRDAIANAVYAAKFGGATGGFNAHKVAYPDIDWNSFSDKFINNYGLKRSRYTTQIDHYDSLSGLFDNIKRINTILIDLSRDMWAYISNEVFKLKIIQGEVGSSTMPHKVNPINFENAEANLMLANTLFEFFSRKLPISRLQRDLTDSSISRNIGVSFGHCIVSYTSLLTGLDKIEVNNPKIQLELENNWVVVAEGLVSILKKHNYPDPYETLKQFTRNNSNISKESLSAFIDSLNIAPEIELQLRKITPFNYTGIV